MHSHLRYALAGIVLIFLTSCGSSGPYQAGRIRTASLEIELSEKMSYVTAGAQWAQGVATGLGGVAAAIPAAMALESVTARHEVSMRDFMHQELEKALTDQINGTGLLSIVAPGQGEGRVKVMIFGWGFMAHPFTGKMRTHVTGNLKITDAGGKKLWGCMVPNFYSQELKNAPAYPRDQIDNNAELMRRELAARCRLIGRDVGNYMTGR